MRIRIDLAFVWQDMWLGLYVDDDDWPVRLVLYFIVVPMLPIIVTIDRKI